MDSIPDDLLVIHAADPQALTRLLERPDLSVTRLERPAWWGRRILQCAVTTPSVPCPACAQHSSSIHQYHRRLARDLPWAGWPCYREMTARRFWCAACHRPFTAPLAAVAPYAHPTRRFAAHLVASGRTGTVAATARAAAHGYQAVEGLFYRTASAAHPAGPPAGLVHRLGIDEIAPRKGHGHFQVVLSDWDAGCVRAQLPDRRQETLRAYLASGSPAQRAAVEEVATDFWAA